MQLIQRVKRWTFEEDEFIVNNYLNMSDEEIGKQLDRTTKAVSSERQKLKLTRPIVPHSTKRKYDKPTFAQLREMFNERDYILLSDESEYVNQSSKMRYICKKHQDKGEQQITTYHLKEGKGCRFCGREKTNEGHKSKTTEQEDKKLCELKDFEYIKTELIDGIYYIFFICNKHRNLGIQKMQRGNMNRAEVCGCQYCYNMNLPPWYVKDTIESKYPHITVLSEYEGMHKPLTCFCNIHNTEFTAIAGNVFHHGKGCKECSKENKSASQLLSKEEVQSRILAKNPDVIILNIDEYKGFETVIWLQCKHCDKIWSQPFHSICANSCRCPQCQCNSSIGELTVAKYLVDNNIDFISQYTFNDCRNIKPLPFDFAIIDKQNNVLGLIEYQGEQHYFPVNYFGGQEKFELQQLRDSIKRKYCIDNGIPFLEIPYNEYKNINTLINNFVLTL